MFATFNSSMDHRSNSNSLTTSMRPKRITVARACDWCRLNRVRCDDGQPCKNCRNRGVQCCKESKSAEQATRSSAAPLGNEPDILRSRGMEMSDSGNKRAEERKNATALRQNCPARGSHGTSSRWHWPGVWVANSVDTKSEPRYYGPSSFMYFADRLRTYLQESLSQPQLGNALHSFTCSSVSSSPSNAVDEEEFVEGALTRQQEEYLLSLFWQSYHTIIPIVDAHGFCADYHSLWGDAQGSTRRPSALVDIILALCMQYSAALMASGEVETMQPDSNDANTAGHWVYQRCQRLLLRDQDTLSIGMLQSYILSAVYLMNASCLSASHRALGIAIHTATSLGLHHEPEIYPRTPQQVLRRRIWRTLFFLDSKLSLELGHPYLMRECDVRVDLIGPVETCPSIPTFGDINSLSYHNECVKLAAKVRRICITGFQKCSEAMSRHNEASIYQAPSVLDSGTSYLHQSMDDLQTWAQDVPPSLKLARKGNVAPFSTARSPLESGVYAPLWLQRQRVLLELLYHNLVMTLYRPYIKFPSVSAESLPFIGHTTAQTTDGSSLCALNHATATINIVHQILTETDILNSWNRAYQYTWDATLTILGFRLAHPMCPHSFSARRATAIAMESFNIFSRYGFSAATQAVKITKEADNAIDFMVQSLLSSGSGSSLKTGPMGPQLMQGAGTLPPFPDLLQQSCSLPQGNPFPAYSMKLADTSPPLFLGEAPTILPTNPPTDLVSEIIDQSWIPNDWWRE
ncbi:fungal-specific transcription factor domain-containing protein [Aspergillus bertholletiae]|uniref:Fungal-specific transcription factor domain-containing protein n=1 Tax=Aspergillus bertholletiae TaxID=1226010 RepID=A0A5N7AUH2_9EURO|nr:fungal-specific transcription factor domain-containing protein [Aspergillus bertholletiae]